MSEGTDQKPYIFDYLNFRNYLNDQVEYLRARNLYSNRKFAQEVGFKSASYLRMVIQRERNLNREAIEKLITAFEMSSQEAEFFRLLVEFDQSKDLKEADGLYKKILANEAYRSVREIAQAEYDFFSNWYMIAVLEAINTPFGELPNDKMAAIIGIEEEKIEKSIELLLKLEMIERKGNRWVKVDRQVQTPIDIQSLNVRNFHREMAKRALFAVDQLPPSERTFAAMTITLSREGYEDFRNRVYEFMKDSNAIYSEIEKSDTVYQLNLQLFPLVSLNSETRLAVQTLPSDEEDTIV